MTQHIATAKSGLCRFKGKNVAVMFGFDRPLNEMFFNIIEQLMETHSLSVLKKSEGVRLNTDLSHLKKSLTAFFISDTLILHD